MSRLFSLRCLTSTRIAFIIAVLQFSGAPIVLAQRYLTTFGLVSEMRSGHSPQSILTGDFNGDGVQDIAVLGESEVRVLVQMPDSLGFLLNTAPLAPSIAGGVAASINGDRLSDLVVVTDHPPSVRVYLGRRHERFFLSWEKELPQPFEKLLVADINSDGKADLLFFGKKQLGITVYRGNGDGTFRAPQTLFPDYSFSALAVSSLRENGLNDLIASDWISSRILIFSAFGNMKFSEPAVLECPGEPDMISVASVDSAMTRDLVVTMPDQRECSIFAADGYGGFHLSQTLTLRFTPAQVAAADLNGDGFDDVCTLDPGGTSLTLLLNDGSGRLHDQVQFDAGRSPLGFALFRHGRTNRVDAAVLDTSREKVRVLYTSAVTAEPSAEQVYGLGPGPTEVLAAEITSHRANDIAVANSESGSLALLLNRGNGTFAGQIPFAAPGHPRHLARVQREDSLQTFLTSSPESPAIMVIEFDIRDFTHTLSPLPTLGPADILSSRIDPRTRNLHIFTLEHEFSSSNASFIEFEQIAPTRFIERSFSLGASSRIVTAVMGDFDGDGNKDLAYVTYDDRAHKGQLFQARGLPEEQFALPRLVGSFDEPEPVPSLLWSADMNADGCDDLFLNLARPVNRLEFYFGSRDTTLTNSPPSVIAGVSVASADRLKLADVNGDGRKDIILDNDLDKSIEVWSGKGDGSFLPARRLMSTEGLGGFTLSDLENDGRIELIMTDSLQGTLRIVRMGE